MLFAFCKHTRGCTKCYLNTYQGLYKVKFLYTLRVVQSDICTHTRGCTYARNADLANGWLAWGNGVLLHRPQLEYDKEDGQINLVQIIDTSTLKVSHSFNNLLLLTR